VTNKVDYQRPEIEKFSPDWDLVDDVVEGQRPVKLKTTTYLPKPNPTDSSPENAARYTQYIERALFVNFGGRTLEGLIGTAFKSMLQKKSCAAKAVINTESIKSSLKRSIDCEHLNS